MGLVPMGLLLHSHRSLHEIRMALHEIHEIRSRMVRATRLLQAQHSGQLNQIALTFLRVFSCRGRGAGKTNENIFPRPRRAIVATVAGADQT